MSTENNAEIKIGITAGAFDLLHAGHVAFLGNAKKRCDKLIVLLHVDPSIQRESKNKPVQTVYERYQQLNACRFVDEVVPYETEKDLYNYLVINNINIRFLGSEYINTPFTGSKLLLDVFYIPREHNYSSTELRERCRK